MSRSYGMTVKIFGHNPEKTQDIIDAVLPEWNWDGSDVFVQEEGTEDEEILFGEGMDNLCGGESEDEFADRVAKAVMVANGGPCEVEVGAICYEYIPSEIHTRDEDFWDSLSESERKVE